MKMKPSKGVFLFAATVIGIIVLMAVVVLAPTIIAIIHDKHKATPPPVIPANMRTAQQKNPYLQPYQITGTEMGQDVKFVSLRAANGETADLTFLPTDQPNCELKSGKTIFLSPKEIEFHYSDFWVAVCSDSDIAAHSFSKEKLRVHFDSQAGVPIGYR